MKNIFRKRKEDLDEELKFYFNGDFSVIFPSMLMEYYVPGGLEIGIDGWMQNCPYSQFTMKDVKMIERTLRTMDVYTVDVLKLFFKPASKGLKEGLEEDFGKFTSLIHLTPTAKRITNQFLPIKKPFANPNDPTEIREVIREICRITKTTSKKYEEQRKHASEVIKGIRKETVEILKEATNKYAEHRKAVKEQIEYEELYL